MYLDSQESYGLFKLFEALGYYESLLLHLHLSPELMSCMSCIYTCSLSAGGGWLHREQLENGYFIDDMMIFLKAGYIIYVVMKISELTITCYTCYYLLLVTLVTSVGQQSDEKYNYYPPLEWLGNFYKID